LATLNEDSQLQLRHASTLKPVGSVSKVHCVAITPDGGHIMTCGNWELKWLEVPTLNAIVTYDVGELIHDDNMDPIRGIYISPNGDRCVLSSMQHGVIILHISDISDVTHVSSYSVRNRVFACDIHVDNERVVVASEDLLVLSLSTGELLTTLRQRRTYHVTLLYNPDRLLYVDDDFNVNIMDMNGTDIMTFEGCKLNTIPPTLKVFDDRRRMVTGEEDGTLRVYDVVLGEMLSCFVEHRSDGFVSVAVHPSSECIVAGNFNRMIYVLKNS